LRQLLEPHGRAGRESDSNALYEEELVRRSERDLHRIADGGRERGLSRVADAHGGVVSRQAANHVLELRPRPRSKDGAAGGEGAAVGAGGLRAGALGRPVVDSRRARALVRRAIHVEPVVETDAEVDDPANYGEQRNQDERELDRRLTALSVLAMTTRRRPTAKSHECSRAPIG